MRKVKLPKQIENIDDLFATDGLISMAHKLINDQGKIKHALLIIEDLDSGIEYYGNRIQDDHAVFMLEMTKIKIIDEAWEGD